MIPPPNAFEVVKRTDSGFTSHGHDLVGEKGPGPPLPKRGFSATETLAREEGEPAAKRRRLSDLVEIGRAGEGVEEQRSRRATRHVDPRTCKRKRSASDDDVAGREERDPKRLKTSNSDGPVVEINYFPSAASHTVLPFADPEWAETRIVAVPGSEVEVLWVCGRSIPNIKNIWPSEWPMGKAAREKKRQRAINEAYAAHQLLCRRRQFVQSEAHQTTLHAEKIANNRRRQELYSTLITPMVKGRVCDALNIRQRLLLYKARLGAIDQHERMRADPAVYDKPWARLEYLDKCAVAKWRDTVEGSKVTAVKIKLQIGVNERPGRQRKWLGCHVVQVSSIWCTAEIVESLLKSTHGLYREWACSQRKEVRAKLAKTRPARLYLLGALRGEKAIGKIESRQEMDEFVKDLLECGRKGDGDIAKRRKAGTTSDLREMAGVVQVVIRPPWTS